MADGATKVELKFLKASEKAICCKKKDGEDIWLPKSQIAYNKNCSEGDMIDVSVEDWLLDEKGLR